MKRTQSSLRHSFRNCFEIEMECALHKAEVVELNLESLAGIYNYTFCDPLWIPSPDFVYPQQAPCDLFKSFSFQETTSSRARGWVVTESKYWYSQTAINEWMNGVEFSSGIAASRWPSFRASSGSASYSQTLFIDGKTSLSTDDIIKYIFSQIKTSEQENFSLCERQSKENSLQK